MMRQRLGSLFVLPFGCLPSGAARTLSEGERFPDRSHHSRGVCYAKQKNRPDETWFDETDYPEDVLEVLTKEEIDALIERIVSNPEIWNSLIDAFREALPTEDLAPLYAWSSKYYEPFMKAVEPRLDSFARISLKGKLLDKARSEIEENKKRFPPQAGDKLYGPRR